MLVTADFAREITKKSNENGKKRDEMLDKIGKSIVYAAHYGANCCDLTFRLAEKDDETICNMVVAELIVSGYSVQRLNLSNERYKIHISW